ncbi:MAG TPA: helix-turn-helix domain-containing protein [Mycobacteriales bacterium]|nr:helix-turn-helix domain-containing protein [Mycobacteriales bacterium]
MSTSDAPRPGRVAGSAGPTRGDAAEAPRPEPSLAEVRFLTVAEVAAVMRVSKMTVYRLVHSGELTAVRVGRSFRVPEKAVHDYLRDAFIEAG